MGPRRPERRVPRAPAVDGRPHGAGRRGRREMSQSHVITGDDGRVRCWWPGNDPLYVAYHDDEWGRPVHDEDRLFEYLTLDIFQAGLSWITILRKREAFRQAFDGFDIDTIAAYGPDDVDR